MTVVTVDTQRIRDWNTFHDVFAKAFGFPGFYGRNLNAWIDCMGSLDAPESHMSVITVQRGEVVTLHLEGVGEFAVRCPEQYDALVECTAFVNWRRVQKGEGAILALS